MNQVQETPKCPTVSSEGFVAVDDDNICTASIWQTKTFWSWFRAKKNVINADSDGENAKNNANSHVIRNHHEKAQNEIAVVPDFHKRILFSDEAHFWWNGYVNKQNCRICSEANPQVYVETPLHPEKTDCLVRFMGWWNPSSKTMKTTTLQSMVIGIEP
ncbi:uncharacterized protein TNCV_895211 [Trichonephila clavipes]|nr:uncharacterized protein TNCV_895211 [Trichonephila clavipes]